MMSKKHILLLLVVLKLFLVNHTLLSKEVNYNVLDTAILNVYYIFSQQVNKNGENFTMVDTMVLSIGQTWSVYYDMNRWRRDSLRNVNFTTSFNFRNISFRNDPMELAFRLANDFDIYDMIDARRSETARIFKNRLNNEVITIDDENHERFFRLREQPLIQEWIITEDTMTVFNYLCYKATTEFRGRKFTAWFTLDIPINDGPWKFYGLPGLILKVQDSENIFSFEAFGLRRAENSVIEMPQNIRFIECENFKQLQRARRERFRRVSFGFIENEGVVFFQTENPITFTEIEIME